MTMTITPAYIFADAARMHEAALERMAAGDIRDAAEKAWCATKRATDALILARTGKEPRSSGQTMRMLRRLRREDPSLEPLRARYAIRQSFLHGACFYDGVLEPMEDIIRDIQETAEYIRDAEAMAGG